MRTAGSATARRTSALLTAAVVVTVAAGCAPPGQQAEQPGPVPTRSTTSPDAPEIPADGDPAEEALAALATLPVKGRSPMTGYDRDAYGQPWLDADRNGCDTRNDVLGDQLTSPVFKSGTGDCKVLAGVLADPYTGRQIPFDDADGDGSGIDIDHVVALGSTWATGASGWSAAELAAVANDPLNLLAVDAGANRSKGDGDAATWLPPRRGFRCAYVARQVAVKAKYDLWVTAPERDAIARVLQRCPGEPLPPDSGSPTVVSFLADDGGRASCADLAAKGRTPVYRGDPDYDPDLDGDGDGVACE